MSEIDRASLVSSTHALIKDCHCSTAPVAESTGIFSIKAWFKLCGIIDVQPSLHESCSSSTYSSFRARILRRIRYSVVNFGYDTWSLSILALSSNSPSSCANDNAQPINIHDIRSERFAGSMTSSSHRFDVTSPSNSFAPSSVVLFAPIISSQSQPSAAVGKCSARGCHSDSRSRASIDPIVLLCALDGLTCPSMIFMMKR